MPDLLGQAGYNSRMSSEWSVRADLSLAEVLAAFTFASDLAFGLELEDGLKSCYVADRIAEKMGLPQDDRITVYYASLLKDAGCTCWGATLAQFWQAEDEIEARRELMIFGGGQGLRSFLKWMGRYVAPEVGPVPRLRRATEVLTRSDSVLKEGFASAAEVCSRISRRLSLPESVQEAALCLFEQWDGNGSPGGIRGEDIPIAARVILPTFLLSPIHRAGGRDAARSVAVAQRGKMFAPDVIDALLALMDQEEFWAELESGEIQQVVIAREPDCEFAKLDVDSFQHVAEAFADFIDLKSPLASAHSRRVAGLTEDIARCMELPPHEVALYRSAGLMHDLGLVAVPAAVLLKPETSLSESERELLRLHPYYGERILDRVPVLAPIKALVASHHERMDGGGYHRGIGAKDIPMGSRIIAVANRYDELTHGEPGEAALDQERALEVLSGEVGPSLDGEVVDALKTSLGVPHGKITAPKVMPAGLTSREAEVLRLACTGLTRKAIAEELSVSESTVRHHLEHIYNKTGTSTRIGAMLFAMEHGLID